MKQVIFWGATGQAKVLREALSAVEVRLLAVFDNRIIPSPFSDVPIFHGGTGLDAWELAHADQQVFACVAVGGDQGRERLELQKDLARRGHTPLAVIHPRSFVASSASVGSGCQILALGAVCAGALLGDAVIINTKASVDHDSVLGDGVHVGPGATVAGEVLIDEFAFVGAGAVVLPRVRIGAGAIIGAGAVVTRDVAAGSTVIGNPARFHPARNTKA